jgi:hypothetical protein
MSGKVISTGPIHEEIERIEHWHQGSIKSFRILHQDAARLGGEVKGARRPRRHPPALTVTGTAYAASLRPDANPRPKSESRDGKMTLFIEISFFIFFHTCYVQYIGIHPSSFLIRRLNARTVFVSFENLCQALGSFCWHSRASSILHAKTEA